MDYIYHYHATFQPAPCQTANLDGIAVLTRRITTHEDYMELKRDIAKDAGANPEKFTICSLTLLGTQHYTPKASPPN